jgi:acyl carrier protein
MSVSFERVAGRISQVLNVPAATLTPETTLAELAANSLILIEMAIDLQEEFDVIVTQAELQGVATLGQLAELLHGRTPSTQ